MNDNVRKIFDMLGVEPNEKFKVGGLVCGHIFTIDENLTISDDSGAIHMYLLTSLLIGEYKIIKLPKKKKLRDLTIDEYKKWKDKKCNHRDCPKCTFGNVMCGLYSDSWVNNKDLYSDKFLDQEIEVE